MLGFQPYEPSAADRNRRDRPHQYAVHRACDAYARRGRATLQESEQFFALAARLFPSPPLPPAPRPPARSAAPKACRPELEELIVANIGEDLADFLVSAPRLSEGTMLKVISTNDVSSAAALARRSDLTIVVLAGLFPDEQPQGLSGARHQHTIAPRGPYLAALARSAQMDHQVAWSLAAREDFDAALLAPAFFDLNESDRIKVIRAFAMRATPEAPIKRTLEQLSVATDELTRALMKLFAEEPFARK